MALLKSDYGWNFWPALVTALVMTAVLGFLVGAVSLRLKEHYFAIFTLCVGFIIFLLLDKWEELTRGALGVRGIAAPDGFGLVNFRDTTPMYYLTLCSVVFIIWFTARLSRSLMGLTFIAIRNGDDLAELPGINLMRNKILAFALSTTYAGLVGGIGTLFGPLIGTLGIVWLTQSLQFMEEYRMIVFGPMLVLLVIYFPLGVSGAFLTWMHRNAQAMAPANKHKTSKVTASSEEAKANA